jgi:hypothetical protein
MNTLYKNKQAITPLTVICWYIVGFIAYVFVFAKMLNQVGFDAVNSGAVVGLEAFMYSNLNMFVFLFSLISLFGMMYYVGGGTQ